MSQLTPEFKVDTIGSGNIQSSQSEGFRTAIQEAVNKLSGTVHYPKELDSIREILSSEKVKQ